MQAILGKKLKMSQIFNKEGACIAVTLIEAGPCVVLKTYPKGEVMKIQLGFGEIRKSSGKIRLRKPQLGNFAKLNISPKKFVKEVEFKVENTPEIGSEITADIFKEGDYIDVTGVSIGKGFQGGMKRWHWAGGNRTHGSTSKRRVGSIGASAYPSRVLKGQHMPGHMGNKRKTIQNLKVIGVEAKKNLLIVKGAVVGHTNSYLIIRHSIKKKAKLEKQAAAVQQESK